MNLNKYRQSNAKPNYKLVPNLLTLCVKNYTTLRLECKPQKKR